MVKRLPDGSHRPPHSWVSATQCLDQSLPLKHMSSLQSEQTNNTGEPGIIEALRFLGLLGPFREAVVHVFSHLLHARVAERARYNCVPRYFLPKC